jgi:isoquinoline 1-oxidoreductase subunit beta
MILDRFIEKSLQSTASVPLTRRRFATVTVGGTLGLALLPATAQQAAKPPPGQAPTEAPPAFVSIAADGTTTILCNRMDMGQGIETALAMVCAEELDVPWAAVRTGFGNQQAHYIDPMFGMHLTGGSNSVKNSYQQYRELGARTKAMLLAAASKQLGVPPAQLKVTAGRIEGGGRSASYGELFAAAMKEPVPEQVVLKDPKDFKIIGKPTGLKVSRAKSTGRQTYAMDVALPGMKTAVVLRPPVFNGKIASLDSADALKMPGVRAVYPVTLDRGGQGVAVVADGYWPARQAREALKVQWDLSGVEKADSAALVQSFKALAKTPGKLPPQEHFKADMSALASAPRQIEAEFVFPYLNHAQMEPLACTVDLREDRCTIHAASQMPGVDAGAAAAVLGMKPEQVEIVVQMAGGGFGRRATPTGEWVREAVAVAKGLAAAGQRAPVKVVWSREDDMRAGYYRPLTVHRAKIGYDEQGRITGWEHAIVSQSIVSGSPFESFLVQGGVDGTTTEGMREPYTIPMRLTVHHPQVNVPVLWWRSVGSTHTAYVMETLLDEIAVATKQDPVAYRMGLMQGDKAARHRAALQIAADKSGYGKRKLPAGTEWGVAVHESFESVVAYVVEASIKDGQPVLKRVTAGVHCNRCINPRTVEAQVMGSVVMALATTLPGHTITLKDGLVEQGNFHQLTMARLPQAPRVDVHIVPSNDPPKGMGEPGLPPLAPAFANAIARLTGKRHREMPFPVA